MEDAISPRHLYSFNVVFNKVPFDNFLEFASRPQKHFDHEFQPFSKLLRQASESLNAADSFLVSRGQPFLAPFRNGGNLLGMP